MQKVWNFFLEARGITEAALKRATLLSVCEAATFEIAQSLVAPNELRTTSYRDIMTLLKSHFSPLPSRIARRHACYKRDQAAGESIPVFVAALRQLARRCEFHNLEESLLDKFCCGVRDIKLQQKLFAKEELTFQGALKEALSFKKAEGITEQLRPSLKPAVNHCEEAVSEGADRGEVLQIHREGLRRSNHHRVPASRLRVRQDSETTSQGFCASCGEAHERQNCRYRNFKCKNCLKWGHVARVCRSKPAGGIPLVVGGSSREIHQGSILQEELYTTSIYPVQSIKLTTREKIHVMVEIQGSPCKMEVDSGSALSIISMDTLKRLCPRNGPRLESAGLLLTDFQGNHVPV